MKEKLGKENIIMFDEFGPDYLPSLHHVFMNNIDGSDLAEIRWNHVKETFDVTSDWSFLKSKQFKTYDEALEYIHNSWIGEIIETWDWDEIRASYPKEYE